MRYLRVILILLIPFFSCRSERDVLAIFKNGEITRKEFHEWLESRRIPVDSVYRDRYSMSDYLRQISVEKLTAVRAEENNYSNEKRYRIIENTLYKNYLSSFLIERTGNQLKFDENGIDLSIIRIFMKDRQNSDPGTIENKRKILTNIIEQLEKGRDFNELAAKYSEDAASRKQGHLGIVPESILDEEILKAAISLEEGEYTPEPVVVKNSLCLVKVHKRYRLTEKNLHDIVTDKGSAERITDFYKNKILDEALKKITAEAIIFSNIGTSSFKKQDESIFSINGEVFTVYELETILNLFYSFRYGMPQEMEFSLKEKKITAERIMRERLFALEAVKQDLDKDNFFIRNWYYLKRATLAGVFKYDKLMAKIEFREDDIRNEYNRNKSSRYYKTKRIGGKEVKVYPPYGELKTIIRNKLSREKLKDLKKQWDSDILSEGRYRIIDKDFSVD